MKFIIDGFPRQANTTLIRLIKNVFGNEISNEYPSHDLESIKSEFVLGSKILFPTRNPLDAIGSFVGMQMIRFPEEQHQPMLDYTINRALDSLKLFQEYIIENINKVHIIKFEDIIKMSEDYKNQNIINNRVINKLSKEYTLIPTQINNQLFDSLSEYSSTKNPEVGQEILGVRFKEKFDLILKNYNYLVNKSY
jgi:hypothetical protein